MNETPGSKRAARAAARMLRAAAHAAGTGAGRIAAGHALAAIAGLRDVATVSAYLPIRDELDPMPAMLALNGLGLRVCVPVIVAPGQPLDFREWQPGGATAVGVFGLEAPVAGEAAEPDVLLVPMLAFDARGHRLGYGGGFYDRTIAALRARPGGVVALGYAYAAQQVPAVPDEATDMRLDAIVTEAGIIRPDG